MRRYYFDLLKSLNFSLDFIKGLLKKHGFDVVNVEDKYEEVLELLPCGVIVHNEPICLRYFVETSNDTLTTSEEVGFLQGLLSHHLGQEVKVHAS